MVTPFDASYYEEYKEKYGCNETHEYANGIHYSFITRKDDGWIGIFERVNGKCYPQTEAVDRSHALSWIALREPVTVPMNEIY